MKDRYIEAMRVMGSDMANTMFNHVSLTQRQLWLTSAK